jgi:hypothetical protein
VVLEIVNAFAFEIDSSLSSQESPECRLWLPLVDSEAAARAA